MDNKQQPDGQQIPAHVIENPIIQPWNNSNIINEVTKYHKVVGVTESDVLSVVSDKTLNPPLYSTIEERLIKQFADSRDMKPSNLLTKMRESSLGRVGNELVKNPWLQRPPQQIQAILPTSNEDLSQLVIIANEISEVKEIHQLTISKDRSKSRDNKTRNRSQSSNSLKSQPCWYHNKLVTVPSNLQNHTTPRSVKISDYWLRPIKKSLLNINEKSSGRNYLIDTVADILVIPTTSQDKNNLVNLTFSLQIYLELKHTVMADVKTINQ